MRNIGIDNLKGLLVILVVIGHAVQINYQSRDADFDENLLFRFIYSFHMPLFMALSGYLYKWPSKLKIGSFYLMIPFLTWGIIDISIVWQSTEDFIDKFINILVNPDSGLWFLYVLFQIHIICHLINLIVSSNQNLLLILIILMLDITVFVTGFDRFGLSQLCWISPFFVLGNLGARLNYKRIHIPYLVILAGIAYVASFYYYSRTYSLYDPIIFSSHPRTYIEYYILKYVCAISILCVFLFLIHESKKMVPYFDYLAKHSLEFYATQFIVIKLINGILGLFIINSNLIIVLNALITIFITTCLIKFVTNVKIIRTLLYGK